MEVRRHTKPTQVIGPFGEALSLADLPKNNMTRFAYQLSFQISNSKLMNRIGTPHNHEIR